MTDLAYYDEDDAPLIQRAVNLAFAPLRLLTSRTAIKAYLSTILFLLTSTILLTISSTAYAVFYFNYVPQVGLEREVYLQYDGLGAGSASFGSGSAGSHPHATVALDTNALITQQAYDVQIVLDMPRTPTNLAAGNFMLELSLLAASKVGGVPDAVSSFLSNTSLLERENVLHRSRRPAILPYSSPIISLGHTILHLPWHFLGFRDLDTEKVVVPMFEFLTFPRGSSNVPTHARVEIQARTVLQVYSTMLLMKAQFQGLRWLIYNYRVGAFVVFTILFYAVSVGSLLLGWAVFSRFWASRSEQQRRVKLEGGASGDGSMGATPTIKNEGDPSSATGTTKVKTEDESESSAQGGLSLDNISDTPAQYPTGRGRQPLTFPGRTTSIEGGESGESADRLKAGEAADDEDEGDAAEDEELRGRAFDSGIGTSMESEHTGAGIVRRRSSRGGKQ